MQDSERDIDVPFRVRVGRTAVRAFRLSAPLILGAVVVRAFVLGGADLLSAPVLVMFLLALVGACTAYALVVNIRSAGTSTAVAWMVAGAIGLDSLMALGAIFVPSDSYGGDRALLADPVFWLFWSVAGALTGFTYFRIAKSMEGPIDLGPPRLP